MSHSKKHFQKKSLFIILAVLILLAVGGTAAFLKWKSQNVSNNFNSARSVDPEIIETFENNVKSDVKIKIPETGYSVYVRAAIVITWKNAEGKILSQPPAENVDYILSIGGSWEKDTDGFYYYKQAVSSGEETDNLINECKPSKDSPAEGYTLDVQIIAQTIQAAGRTDIDDGRDAKTDVWK